MYDNKIIVLTVFQVLIFCNRSENKNVSRTMYFLIILLTVVKYQKLFSEKFKIYIYISDFIIIIFDITIMYFFFHNCVEFIIFPAIV